MGQFYAQLAGPASDRVACICIGVAFGQILQAIKQFIVAKYVIDLFYYIGRIWTHWQFLAQQLGQFLLTFGGVRQCPGPFCQTIDPTFKYVSFLQWSLLQTCQQWQRSFDPDIQFGLHKEIFHLLDQLFILVDVSWTPGFKIAVITSSMCQRFQRHTLVGQILTGLFYQLLGHTLDHATLGSSAETCQGIDLADHFRDVHSPYIIGPTTMSHMLQHGTTTGQHAKRQLPSLAFGCFYEQAVHVAMASIGFTQRSIVADHESSLGRFSSIADLARAVVAFK